jgi:hypothetical protein
MTENIETLEHDANACELECPHGPDSREAKLEDGFIDSLNGPGFAELNRQFRINDPRITERARAAKATFNFNGAA